MTVTKNTNKVQADLKKEDILALDIATHTGFFSIHERGTWDFTESKKNDYKQHLAFREKLIETINKYNLKLIVAEDVSVGTHFVSIRKLSELRGVLLEVCDEMNLPEPIFINPTIIKMFGVGKGNATKEEMVAAMTRKYNLVPVTDDEADACHIFYYFTNKYRIQ